MISLIHPPTNSMLLFLTPPQENFLNIMISSKRTPKTNGTMAAPKNLLASVKAAKKTTQHQPTPFSSSIQVNFHPARKLHTFASAPTITLKKLILIVSASLLAATSSTITVTQHTTHLPPISPLQDFSSTASFPCLEPNYSVSIFRTFTSSLHSKTPLNTNTCGSPPGSYLLTS